MSGLAETMIESKDIDSSISMASPTLNPHGGKPWRETWDRADGDRTPRNVALLSTIFPREPQVLDEGAGGQEGQGRAIIDWGDRLASTLRFAAPHGMGNILGRTWAVQFCTYIGTLTHSKSCRLFQKAGFRGLAHADFCSGAGGTFNE